MLGFDVKIFNGSGVLVTDWHESQSARAAYMGARRFIRSQSAVTPDARLTARLSLCLSVMRSRVVCEFTCKLKPSRSSGRRAALTDTVLRNRHNKTARGLTRTAYRSGHKLDDTALALAVRGSSDRLAYGLLFRTERKPCGACGSKCNGARALNDAGRRALARARMPRTASRCTRSRAAYFTKERMIQSCH
jgi:hypothetical protein